MEAYGQGYGYIAYVSKLNRDYHDTDIIFDGLGDRAQVYVNRTLQGIVYVNDERQSVKINAKSGDTLTILVENMGRANFGPKMMRKKGIAGRLLLGRRIHFNWDVYTLPMDNLEKLDFGKKPIAPSRFYKGNFTVDEAQDTFVYLDNFTKGFVVINGFNLGRYWEIGPQRSLYVPASILKEGENEIIFKINFYESDEVYDVLFGTGTEGLKNKLAYDTTIEACYLQGDFGVYSDKPFIKGKTKHVYLADEFYIAQRKDTVSNTLSDGYPLFAGNITLRSIVENPQSKVLRLDGEWCLSNF